MTLALIGQEPRKDEFATVFNRLAVALREKDIDAATMRVYYETLKDLPAAALEGGAAALMREPGRKWFPTTAEWRAAAELAQETLLRKAVKPARAEPWHLECERCEDTGWVAGLECPGDATCGRTKTHAAHSFTRACPCRPTNRTWMRTQKFGSGA